MQYILLIFLFMSLLSAKNFTEEEYLTEDKKYYDNAIAEYQKGNYQNSLEYFQKSLLIREKILGEDHLETAQVYNNLGVLYQQEGNYKEALKYYKKDLKILEKILGKDHLDTATSYNNLGSLYYDIGNFSESLIYYQKSLSIRENILGENDVVTGETYNNLGLLYQEIGDYSKALFYYKKDLKIVENVLGKDNINTGTTYNNLGLFYQSIGNYVKALNAFEKSLAIVEKHLGKKHLTIAMSYNNFGSLYYKTGDYKNALFYYKKSLSIREEIVGENHFITSESYNNLALVYNEIGDYTQALEYFNKSSIIMNKSLDQNHLNIATGYNNIALVYQKMGDYANALSFFEKDLQVIKEVFGEEHLDVATNYNNIASVYYSIKDYSKALEYFKKSLSIREKILDEYHTLTAENYNNIALIYHDTKHYHEALKYFFKSSEIYKMTFGDQHTFPAITYNNIGLVYKDIEDYFQAYEYLNKSFQIFIKDKTLNFISLNTQQKEKYIKKNDSRIDSLLGIAILYLNKLKKNKRFNIQKNIVNSWLNHKGSVFDSENKIITLYNTSKDSKLKEKIESLMVNNRILANFYQTIIEDEKKRQNKISTVKREIDNLTYDLAKKSLTFQEQQGLKSINHKAITKNLKPNELYIDYAKAGDYYYIFTLDNQNQIDFIQIDENSTKKIDALLMSFREEINNLADGKKQQDSKEKLSQLYKLLIKEPLKEKLKNKTSLIISPDGALRLLPFEALYDKEHNKYLIQSKEIRYIPSGKEFVRLHKYAKKRVSTNNTITVFANPNFDSNQSASFHKEQIALTRGTNENIIKPFFKESYSPLIGTEAEAKAIDTIMGNVEIFEGNRANETNLLAIKEPKILHIATHGFFINTPNIPNPMLKSGIVLSGVNHHAKRKQGYGRVTALKLSGLNLRSTDLVVLSACETGVVDVNDTDSISGLGKAFIQAGAKDVVMSLWSVDDNATKELMIDFYRGIKEHSNYSRALREAKLKMIDEGQHPFYWGGFVLNGL